MVSITNRGDGQSRAAKKRAKKNKKNEPRQQNDQREELGPKSHHDETAEPEKKKKKRNVDVVVSPEILQEVTTLTPGEIMDSLNEGGNVDEPDTDSLPTSTELSRLLFESILSSNASTFYKEYWEKKPYHLKSSSTNRLDNIFSKADITRLLSHQALRYGKDINVTNFIDSTGDGVKRRINQDLLPKSNSIKANNSASPEYIIADSKDVWSNFEDAGCTIRLLCPHKYCDRVHTLLSLLELELGCMTGSNAYLTPQGKNQGFAPHYDDIEAFILQLEGSKHWKVYPPMSKEKTLPRESSRDFTEAEMAGIEPIIDVVLNTGDVLYIPRGWVHCANTIGDVHSLHLTVSAMQNWAWGDLMEIVMPQAFQACLNDDSTSLREGLPRNFLEYMGIMNDVNDDDNQIFRPGIENNPTSPFPKEEEEKEGEENNEEALKIQHLKKMQAQFKEQAKKRITKVCSKALSILDAGCDQIAKRFLSDRLPPSFTKSESTLTSENRAQNGGKLFPNTLCRLARPGIARLVMEDDKAILYHCVDNDREYHGNALSPMEFEVDDGPALEMLLTTVEPRWICVNDLIHGDIEDKVEIAQALFDEGILAIRQLDKPEKMK